MSGELERLHFGGPEARSGPKMGGTTSLAADEKPEERARGAARSKFDESKVGFALELCFWLINICNKSSILVGAIDPLSGPRRPSVAPGEVPGLLRACRPFLN